MYVSLWWHSRAACCYAKPALLSMGWINKTAKHCVFQPRVASLSRTLTISSNYTTPWWICLPFIGKIFHLCLEAYVFVLLCYRCVSDKHPWSRTLLKTSRVGITEPMSSWESCRSFSPFFRFDVCPLYITFIFVYTAGTSVKYGRDAKDLTSIFVNVSVKEPTNSAWVPSIPGPEVNQIDDFYWHAMHKVSQGSDVVCITGLIMSSTMSTDTWQRPLIKNDVQYHPISPMLKVNSMLRYLFVIYTT